MGFNAQAFATALLEGQATDIKGRFAEAKYERQRQEELALRNLPLYKKRQAQKKTMLSLAGTLEKLGADRENIMYFAKDGPETLKAITKIISDKNQKLYDVTGEYLTEEQINNMMKTPQEFEEVASEYDSVAEFLERGYRLSEQNDKVEKPENAEIMSGNFLMGLMGYGAKDRVKERLETEKFIGDVSIAEMNRIAAMEDFADPTGGTFDPAVVDPASGPRVISTRVKDSIITTQDTLATKYQKDMSKMTEFLVSKGIKSELTSALASAVSDPQMAQGEITPAIVNEFKERMKYEAFEEAARGYNLGRAEIKQVSPAFLNLYDKYGVERKTTDYINRDALVAALKAGLGPGKYTIMEGGEVTEVTVTQDEINMLMG
tara:strand:- start:3850 stop:4977 length:1128 start_codon:yes stop_codon:yes gene_type:complete